MSPFLAPAVIISCVSIEHCPSLLFFNLLQAITQIALITPNLDELAAMAMAAQETIQRGPTNASINFITGPVAAKDSRKFVEAFSKDKEPPAPDATATATATAPQSCKREEGGRVRVGHELAQQVIVDGKLVDTKPLGAALASVLRAMLLPEDMVEEGASLPLCRISMHTLADQSINASPHLGNSCLSGSDEYLTDSFLVFNLWVMT